MVVVGQRERETYLVQISEERLDHRVLLAELRCPLLAVLGGPGGEHGAGSGLQQETLCSTERGWTGT